MGFDIAIEKHSWSHLRFIFFLILFIIVARAANVFSCAYLVNLARHAHRQIPLKHQQALWYSGLHGAMAFALALQSVHDLPEGHGQTIFSATTVIVVLTKRKKKVSVSTILEYMQRVFDADLIEMLQGSSGNKIKLNTFSRTIPQKRLPVISETLSPLYHEYKCFDATKQKTLPLKK
ncbi:hypothetical protein KPL70_003897 [Citrus sinensis]|nr:hypothetical protein KPL70_003897 [Citrus sinensis]